VASTGDAEFLAVLKTTEHVAGVTGLPVEIGMSSEMVLGFHGQLEYEGTRLAGLWPHQQLELCEKAGAAIFGPVVNTNTKKSTPWNLSRAVTFVKACTEIAKIPIHANVGMGVGGVPMFETPAVDAVTRCSAAMVEIGRCDGL
jgi:dimethylamine--corrinoid protein Co-methyltransferase